MKYALYGFIGTVVFILLAAGFTILVGYLLGIGFDVAVQ